MTSSSNEITETEALDLVGRSHGNPVVVSDPGSELVDTDPAHDTPASPSPLTEDPKPTVQVVLSYAGANAGGQALNVCTGRDGCGALVQEEFSAKHLAHHENSVI